MFYFLPTFRNPVFSLLLAAAVLGLSSGESRAQNQGCVAPKFQHPGVLSNLAELQKIKQHIAHGDEPWKSAYDVMQHSQYASLDYTPHPVPIVSSGISNAHPVGTLEESGDNYAAYTLTLMWIFSGDERYAKKAAEILDAWSSTLKGHQGANWYLQASWEGSMFPMSAELLRATYPKWSKAEIAQFKTMLDTAILPLLHDRMAFGNREMSTINAMMAIGVFNEDAAAFCEGLSHWKSYVPDYIYLASDGPLPEKPRFLDTAPSDETLMAMNASLFPNGGNWIETAKSVTNYGEDRTAFTKWDVQQWWYNPGGQLIDGLSQETGRDLGHSELAMAAIFNAAEIAWHQGIDLYTPNAKRLAAFLETSASLRLGAKLPTELYAGKLDANNNIVESYEIGFNHLTHQNNMSLPLTERLLKTVIRPVTEPHTPPPPGIAASNVTGPVSLLSVWQTLTHAQ